MWSSYNSILTEIHSFFIISVMKIATEIFDTMLSKEGDAFGEVKSASSPAGGGEVGSFHFNSPINLI